MTTLLATAIGAAAAQTLASGEKGSVNGITSRGIFCATPGGQIIFVSYETWRGPLTINLVPIHPPGEETLPSQADFLKSSAPFDRIAPGGSVEMQVGQLQFIDLDLRIICGQLQPWEAIGAITSNPNLPEVRQWLRQVVVHLLEKKTSKGWIEYLSGWTVDQAWGKRYKNPLIPGKSLDQLRQALDTRSPEGILSAVNELLGKGGGLTPSGDDVVIGLLLSLIRLPGTISPGVDTQVFMRQVIALARQKTTWLGASLIACAADGQADERLVTTLEGIFSGDLEPGECAARLAAYGGSSGGDTLLGMVLGLRG